MARTGTKRAGEANVKEAALLAKLKSRVVSLEREAHALSIAIRDPRVPWYARICMGLVLAYAFSPIDLIPDFIPVLGYLDDLLLVPLGIALAVKMIPVQVMKDARQKAQELTSAGKPVSRAGAILVIGVWLVVLTFVAWVVAGVVIKRK